MIGAGIREWLSTIFAVIGPSGLLDSFRREDCTLSASQARRGSSAHGPGSPAGALLLPYVLYSFVGDVGDALSLLKLWDGLWPVLAGDALGLARVADRLPRVPTGDTIVVGEAAFDRILGVGALFDRIDAAFRRWPSAGLALLAITLALVYATGCGG